MLEVTDLPAPEPGEGQVLVDVEAAGLNYADTHQTEDSYLAPQTLPLVPGAEVVGVARGGRYDGRRVVALLMGGGGYAEQAVAHESVVHPIDDLDAGKALALVLQGTTAWHLLRTCANLTRREKVAVHAAAGGVGTLAVQLAKHWGAGRVVATASTQDKRDLALSLGADAAVDVSTLDDADAVAAALTEANGGRPLDVVLEMTGGHVFDGSLKALAPLGRLVTFGMASRTPPSPVNAGALMASSRAVMGFWLVHALRRPGGFEHAMSELVSLTESGVLRPVVGGTYPLDDVARAHEDLRGRRSVGKLVLEVSPR